MSSIGSRRCCGLIVVLLCAASSIARAGSLTPNPANGNPHSVGPINTFTDSLKPDPAIYRGPDIGCPWLVPAAQAAAQPYNNGTNTWNFNYAAAFNGT